MDLKKELDIRSKLMFISRNLKIHQKISVTFLICDKPYSGLKMMDVLLATDSRNLQNKAFFTWAKKQMLFSCTDWRVRMAEVLACIQNYRLVKYLGYGKDELKNKAKFISNVKVVLYKLCEELNQAESESLSNSVDEDYNISDSKVVRKSYLERKILDWSVKNIINTDTSKKINLAPVLKYLHNFNLSDIVSDMKTVIDSMMFNFVKSIKTSQLQNSLQDYYTVIDKINLGVCVIINEKNFLQSDLKQRWGSNKDVERLKEVFTAYGFKIRVHTDVVYDELVYLLNQYARLINATDSFFVLIILSHGSENVVYTTDSIPIPMNTIEMIFQAENCPNLIGKPKIFIIQSCQGQKWQKVFQGTQCVIDVDEVEVGVDAPCVTSKNHESMLVGPQKGDSIIAWSTVQGYASFRDKHNGSWYIEELCTELWRFGQITDLIDILTLVNNNLRSKTYDGQFMVPSLLSSLSGKIQFPYVEENWLKGRQLKFKRLFFEIYFLEFIRKSEITRFSLLKAIEIMK